MITIISSIFAVAFILLCARAVAKDYPDSAIALARHDLFRQRDALFDIAADGHVGFDHPGYKAAREMLNGFIRYAHDLSLTQLILTRTLLAAQKAKLPNGEWEAAIASLPQEAGQRVQAVLDDATVTMLRLMITRSLFLSATLAVLVVARAAYVTATAAANHIRTRSPQEHKSPADDVYEEVLSHEPGTRFTHAVKQEAKRYSQPPFGYQLQAA